MRNRQAGYTLYELIVTIAMLGISGLFIWIVAHFISKYW